MFIVGRSSGCFSNFLFISMQKFLFILIIIFSCQSLAKADDIRDFEIEGMSIGDSLLTFFNEDLIQEEINSDTVFIYKDNKFIDIAIGSTNIYPLNKDLRVYETVGITLKPNDQTYEIYAIDGRIDCEKISLCLFKKKEIASDLISFFGKNATKEDDDGPHAFDKTGKSKSYWTTFRFKSDKSVVRVIVTDWSNDINNNYGYEDNLKVEIISSELYNFLSTAIYE